MDKVIDMDKNIKECNRLGEQISKQVKELQRDMAIRRLGVEMHDIYNSFFMAGFTREQAYEMTLIVLDNGLSKSEC